jgi:hypothetical protein
VIDDAAIVATMMAICDEFEAMAIAGLGRSCAMVSQIAFALAAWGRLL